MSKSNSRRRRDNFSIANQRLPTTFMLPRRVASSILTEYEDRRQWHPEGVSAPARSFSQTRHRLTLPKQVKRFKFRSLKALRALAAPTAIVAFREPQKVLICVRRKRRKEVLHALRKVGRYGQKKPRFSEYSSISC